MRISVAFVAILLKRKDGDEEGTTQRVLLKREKSWRGEKKKKRKVYKMTLSLSCLTTSLLVTLKTEENCQMNWVSLVRTHLFKKKVDLKWGGIKTKNADNVRVFGGGGGGGV